MAGRRRLIKELKWMHKNPMLRELGILIVVNNEPYLNLDVIMIGPEGSPYEGGIFNFCIVCSPEYPFQAPTIKFSTKIWHPLIDASGRLSMSLLWSWHPLFDLSYILVEVRKTLEFNFDVVTLEKRSCSIGFGNKVARYQYRSEPENFFIKAKEMTLQYAIETI